MQADNYQQHQNVENVGKMLIIMNYWLLILMRNSSSSNSSGNNIPEIVRVVIVS